ncbi:LacI family DNA-binding transcriptional regulator [Coraliomargarita sp. SDUM461004]|uniref:LacI family DNA-binding transcriptional regulator n=1 Tax=Thalassobacterium sedimentorum TaxID=3041258 RepID=A0ABU1AI95_9BACT|nr:LacI family DNA-binding transcriptional regulator [Coraliomargarita sp. SDUM461004]MDQ8193506.1 LacI family DNA-binding transcriptional regulator [Coraliomargarita sp. SDUM461004]
MPNSSLRNEVSLRDIAAKLGVNVSTVSRALNNQPKVSAALRARVLETANTMGYRPNPYVTRHMEEMRRGQRLPNLSNVAYLNFFAKKNPHYQRVINGAKARAEQLGYHFQIVDCDEKEMMGARLERVLLSRGIRGIILSPPSWESTEAEVKLQLDWSHFAGAIVTLNQSEIGYDRVYIDPYFSARECVNQAIQLGYKSIFLVDVPILNTRLNHLHKAGFLVEEDSFTHSQQGLHFEIIECCDTVITQKLKRFEKPVLLTYVHIPELALSCPQDYGVIYLTKPIGQADVCGIAQKKEVVGQFCMDLLAQRLSRGEFGFPSEPKLMAVQGVWELGNTVCKS